MSPTRDAPSIAVVIPVYNGEAYVGAAIESALAQTYPPAEIVVLDDASTDATARVIDRYRGHPLVRAHRLDARVLAAATWNRAIALTGTDYFVVLGHDDLLHPRFLAAAAKALQDNPGTGFVVTGYRLIDAAGKPIEDRPIRRERLLGKTPFDMFFHELVVANHFYFRDSGSVISRAAFDAIGGFDERFYATYDYDLYLRLAGTTPTFGVGEMLVDYRVHADNMSAEIYRRDRGDCDVIFSKLDQYWMLDERQKRELVVNISLFQFQYVSRAVRCREASAAEVREARRGVGERLARWARAGSRYSRHVRERPARLRQWLAWRACAHPAGVALIRTALRFGSRPAWPHNDVPIDRRVS